MRARLRSWWQQIQQLSFIATGMIVTLLLFMAFIFAAYRFGWSGTGFLNKTLWDWLQLLIIPTVLAIGVFWLNQLQKSREEKAVEQRAQIEHEIAIDNQREAPLQGYLDRITELVLQCSAQEKPLEKVAVATRLRTLNLLRRLDNNRKKTVI